MAALVAGTSYLGNHTDLDTTGMLTSLSMSGFYGHHRVQSPTRMDALQSCPKPWDDDQKVFRLEASWDT